MNEFFYCYSDKLYHFLASMSIRYVDKGINHTSNKQYWRYNKSETLDRAIAHYNEIKHIFKIVEKKNIIERKV